MAPALVHQDLGSADYDVTWDLQRSLRERLLADEGPCVLLTLEHSPAVITGGRRSDPADLLTSADDLARRGILLRNIERGGSWTWHGPGQLVAYPVVALRRRQLKVPAFVAGLEWAMAQLLERVLARCSVDPAALGLRIGQLRGFPGTWVERADGTQAKVGAVGVHVRRFVSLHGMALNLRPEPWGFQWIVPCGLENIETTSAARLVTEFGGDTGALPTVEAAGVELAQLLPACWSPPSGQGAVCLSASGSAASPAGPSPTR